ncbi:MAG: N-acetylneuraminate synthase family protein [Spirochaetales bacterium]
MYLIAEIGSSHGGSLESASRLLDEVAAAGFDCAKFQWIIADEILHPDTGYVHLPGGAVALYDRFRALEREAAFYGQLKRLCSERDIDFLCTAFGPGSLEMLLKLGVNAVKIASPELNYTELLRLAAAASTPLYVSTGVSTLCDIAEAAETLASAEDVTFLHCVTSYPAPETEYNLDLLAPLSTVTGRPWGVSDHSTDPLAVPLVSAALGATALEKHVTLSQDGSGLDDPIALSPKDFRLMVSEVRALTRAYPPATTGTAPADKTGLLRSVEDKLGAERVASIRGNGVKRLAPAERDNYGRSNRSLHARTKIPEGTNITPAMVCVVRSELRLTPGLHPRYRDLVIGAVAQRTIEAGEGIRWDALIESAPPPGR